MIGYITLGTDDLSVSAPFYDELFSTIGANRFMEEDSFIAWATSPEAPSVCLIKPFDGQPMSVGNGTMVAIAVENPEQVDAFYRKAIALGATDEGEPGIRPDNFYAGYFRTPEGHKFNAFCFVAE